jgi:hypothetical protein
MSQGQAFIAFTVTVQVLNLMCLLGIWKHIRRIADSAERAHPAPPIEYDDTDFDIKR